MRTLFALVLVVSACTSPTSPPTPKPVSVPVTSPVKRPAEPAAPAKAAPMSEAEAEAEACADCHPDEVAHFAQTGMGRSLYRPSALPPIEDFSVIKATVPHPKMPAIYRAYIDAEGVWWQEETIKDTPDYRRRVRVDYVIGSGNHTRSYLGTVDGELVQLPLTWYSQARRWDISPGYEGAGHLRFWRPVGPECLFCHTGFTPADPRYEAKYTAPLTEGITCTRCHGDTAAHLAARTRGAPVADVVGEIFNPARQSAERAAEVCQQCHLQGEVRVLAPDRRWDAYDVTTPLAGHHTAFVFPQADAGSSIAGHGARLARSKCARSSGDRLRCTTCHDPHGAQVTGSVDAVCAQCHQEKRCGEPAGRKTQAGCVRCHMVKTGTTDIPHVRITDHFIQRRPTTSAPKITAETLVPARPLPADVSAQVARGQAMIKAGRLRHPNLRKAGVAVLGEALSKRPGAARTWTRLGTGHLAVGDHDAALAAFDRALALDPKAVLSREEHAYAAAGAGRLQSAVASLREAVALRPDFSVGLGLLGNLLCQMGRCAEAIPFLSRAERSSPSDSTLAFNHAAALLKTGRVDAAIRGFARAMTVDPLNHRATVEWAQLALAKGETIGAVKVLSRVTKLAPTTPAPRLTLARALVTLGDLGEAAFQLDRYIALAPDDPNGYLARARVAHQAGDRTGVKRSLDQGRTRVPGFPWDQAAADLTRTTGR